jgi:hypothetical protein
MFRTKVVEELKTHIFRSAIFFSSENRAVYETCGKNIVEWDRPQLTIWRIRNSRWITKAINTHSQYVIRITFPLQQWLQECPSLLRCTYIACLVPHKFATIRKHKISILGSQSLNNNKSIFIFSAWLACNKSKHVAQSIYIRCLVRLCIGK